MLFRSSYHEKRAVELKVISALRNCFMSATPVPCQVFLGGVKLSPLLSEDFNFFRGENDRRKEKRAIAEKNPMADDRNCRFIVFVCTLYV